MASFTTQISFILVFLLFATTLNRSVVALNGVIRCNENDQRLLLIFKQGVVDPYNQLSSWTVEEGCCSWEGVYCNEITGRVTELSLFNHTLQGEINLCVLQLQFLNHLDLSYNDFKTVSMPPCQIPKSPSDAHKFDNQSLVTPSNQSASFSISLQLSSLKYLDLSNNDIGNETKWLHYIAMLPSLTELNLSGCELRDFPSLDYINFTSLEVLDLSYNFYTMKSKLPDLFFNITNHIYYLDLKGCNLYGKLPKAMLNLENLKHLDLSSNHLEGSISNWLGHYERLQYLNIQRNLFNGVISSSLGNISSLLYLDLSYNQLSGSLPKTLGQLHSLTSLDLSHNHFNGNLPESLGELNNLNYLCVGGNSWVGVLTEKNFLNLSNLNSLDLSSTSFIFDIDPKWIPPFQLELLDMGNTRIGPNVPAWLYTQRSLRYLDISASGISKIDAGLFWRFLAGIPSVDLSNNLISDDISNVILSASMSFFSASNNSLTGSIFSLLCHQSNGESMTFIELDLSYNCLSGELPNNCWTNWKSLSFLKLGSNMLRGKVPPSMASLANLRLLDLSHNSFIGKFSVDFSNWTFLEDLILERNKFSGSLPNTMQQSLHVIKLRENQFMGNIPSRLCNLTLLTILDLADNKLSGPIPHCLYKIMQPIEENFPVDEIKVFAKGRELGYNYFMLDFKYFMIVHSIDLSTNNLSGEIPKELFNLTQMWSLNLSHNHLIGKIPEEIGGMKELESLDLSYNKISGEIPSTMSNLSFLDFLNLSYNNFIGQIPLGTQIQSFESWSFVGNVDLCGDPLPKKCDKKEASHHSKSVEENEDDDFLKSLYLGMGVGFAVGFWGVCGSLFLIRAWRRKFFQLFHFLMDQLYVIVAFKLRKA